MTTQDTESQIRNRIDAFVNEISELIRLAALDVVQGALGGGTPVPVRRRGPGRPRGVRRAQAPRRGGKRVRRSSANVQELAAAVQSAVRKGPGRRLGEIAAELGTSSKEIRRPAQNLVEERKLRTEGQRGGTRYFPAGARGAKAGAKAARKTTKRGGKRTKRGGRRKTAAAGAQAAPVAA